MQSVLMPLVEIWILLTLTVTPFPLVWDKYKLTQPAVYRILIIVDMVLLPPRMYLLGYRVTRKLGEEL